MVDIRDICVYIFSFRCVCGTSSEFYRGFSLKEGSQRDACSESFICSTTSMTVVLAIPTGLQTLHPKP